MTYAFKGMVFQVVAGICLFIATILFIPTLGKSIKIYHNIYDELLTWAETS